MKKIIAVMPARYASTRFPGKPLAVLCGKPMIQWGYETVSSISGIDEVYVATDDDRIYNVVSTFGGKAIMTGECACGTDRVYEASKDIDADIIINVQGDEPLIKPQMIEQLITAFENEDVDMVTLKKKIDNKADINNSNIVKVITDQNDDAIYFSRYPIPYNRDDIDVTYYKHIGIYGFKKQFLEKYVKLPRVELEKAENLEQLRVLEFGYKIKVLETKMDTIGVDCRDDLDKVEVLLNNTKAGENI